MNNNRRNNNLYLILILGLLTAIGPFSIDMYLPPDRFSLGVAQKPWNVPIPGTTKLHRLAEDIGAASLQLSAEELQEIEAASVQIKIMGNRYTEALEKTTGL